MFSHILLSKQLWTIYCFGSTAQGAFFGPAGFRLSGTLVSVIRFNFNMPVGFAPEFGSLLLTQTFGMIVKALRVRVS